MRLSSDRIKLYISYLLKSYLMFPAVMKKSQNVLPFNLNCDVKLCVIYLKTSQEKRKNLPG